MEPAEHIDHIRADGALLADAAERAGMDAAVAWCPEWQVRDLVRHQGDVHRWAAFSLGRGTDTPMSDEENDACLLTWPDDDESLLGWFREGHARLVETLQWTPDDAIAFAFLPAPTPRAFWARRQAHETAIHRADAESATGDITPYDAAFAADGIDEMVRGFATRPGKVTADPPQTMLLEATDAGRSWWLNVGAEGRVVADAGSDPDCTVRGTASDLYLLVWNRRTADELDVSGEGGMLEMWRSAQKVRWTGPTRKE